MIKRGKIKQSISPLIETIKGEVFCIRCGKNLSIEKIPEGDGTENNQYNHKCKDIKVSDE